MSGASDQSNLVLPLATSFSGVRAKRVDQRRWPGRIRSATGADREAGENNWATNDRDRGVKKTQDLISGKR